VSDDVQPACGEFVRANSFRALRHRERDEYRPCSYCFGEGECVDDYDRDELVVACAARGEAIHRHEETGPARPATHSEPISTVAKQLKNPDITHANQIDFSETAGGDGENQA